MEVTEQLIAELFAISKDRDPTEPTSVDTDVTVPRRTHGFIWSFICDCSVLEMVRSGLLRTGDYCTLGW